MERLRTRNGRPDGFGIGPVCDEAADEIERLRSVVAEAAEDIESWAAYADPYFQQKHDLAGCIAKYKNALLPNV